MFSDYNFVPDHSPALSTPYLDPTVDTPFTPPYFASDTISPYLAFASFNNTPILKQDVCLAGYLNQEDTAVEFSGDPTQLLIDKSKTPQLLPLVNFFSEPSTSGLFPPLDSSQESSKVVHQEQALDEFSELMHLSTPLSDTQDKPKKRGRKRMEERKKTKAYECPYCDHVSKRRYNLSTHIKTHDKNRVKAFECSQCFKRFDRRHDRDRHLATVHRTDRSFACKTCSVRFSRRDALDRHVEQQHDD
ncbi:hypothetical protein G6F46_011629 [Rhizopus delemar]|uniref:C2H2-type domain-containing protein n=3 Tax=Rhizopus TaxID=4842 RepID=I1CJ99_RHIO9|nr:hypothetical protein RO3G_13240 [Rhizopus delemar RA 99-880]KAG1447043.1 hypothetical protein G6F55_011284 [Rhizopus delemar]KAG1535076.1 hypothetical protein G6F51_011732 [Rhizopus arrhizus]KAG1499782.1 hypothetical protein G6F54_004166 [Rhizopus delemar]KAG1500407.1 hypothetical protein G6F53_011312 [Rhizopus delemar]|eukprot:EIE88529.1 hypothetical protein RO3G_13240 [Rhizopus delemar RA 99-880]